MNDFIDDIASEALKATLTYAKDSWTEEAQKGLKSTRPEYIPAIRGVFMESPLSGYIELVGRFPVMLEEGFSSFDMKDGFMKSPKKKETKDGNWYLTVPYRHRTSGNTSVMPNSIKKHATKLSDGDRLSQLLVRQLGYEPQTSKTGYAWENSKFDSLQRIVKEYSGGAKRSQYMTFRRVSSKSDPKSWIHPGYKGLKALEKVSKKAEEFFYDYMD